MSAIRRLAIVYLLLAASPAALMSQDRSVLYPGIGATVNGKAAKITSVMFDGDNIQTGAGPAQIVENGSIVRVEPHTSLRYGSSLVLKCGAVTVTGRSVIEVNGRRVAGLNPSDAKFDVVNRDGKLRISVQSGSVSFGDEVMNARASISLPGAAGCENPVAGASKGRSKTLGVAAGGAAAAGTCLAYWCRSKEKISPSRLDGK